MTAITVYSCCSLVWRPNGGQHLGVPACDKAKIMQFYVEIVC